MPGTPLHVLIIAHPDDESMFFVPTLQALKDTAVWIICLTTGDYDGLGKVRSKEMLQAGQLLNVEKVLVCDNLKDHPTERWDIAQVQQEIASTLKTAIRSTNNGNKSWSRLVLITFDQYGVSGHVNHIDTHLGVCAIVGRGGFILSGDDFSRASKINIPVEAWSLASERNIVAKYIPFLSWLLLFLSFFRIVQDSHRGIDIDSSHQCYRLHEPSLNWKAMTTHKSQFVWYRRLFVVFSCYTYVNTLQRISTRDKKER
jgi:N-acetylglucosaminylphosphatidylinositol deacetylase